MENQGKQLFEGLTVHFGWTEGEQLKLPSGEIIKENQTFHGEKAYEVLVAMALKDKKLYDKKCMGTFMGYDKCQFTISLPLRDGKGNLEIENFESKNRVDLSELQLNCGGGPLDSLAWRLAGQKVELYKEYPSAFKHSYEYAEINKNNHDENTFVNGHSSIKLARKKFIDEHEKILNTFYPYIYDEDKYLTQHPDLKKEFQENTPKLYKFLIKAEDFEKYVPKCEFISFEVAKNLNGKIYDRNYHFTPLDERNFQDVKNYNKFNDYYLLTSAFNLGEWELMNGKFIPYFTQEEFENIQNINKFSLTSETEEYAFKNYKPYKCEFKDDKYVESEFPKEHTRYIKQGKDAIDELQRLILQELRDKHDILEKGFNFEKGKRHIILKYDDNVILDEISHSGIDNNLINKCCNENSIGSCIPITEDISSQKEKIKDALINLNMYFNNAKDFDFYITKADVKEANSEIPSLEEMNKNRIKFLEKEAENATKYQFTLEEISNINNALMVLADKLADKLPTPKTTSKLKGEFSLRGEKFAIAYTIVAAEAGFDKDTIKTLASEVNRGKIGNSFEKKVNSTLRTKKINEIFESKKQNNVNSR